MRIWAALAVAVLLCGFVWWLNARPAVPSATARVARAAPSSASPALLDPLAPGRPPAPDRDRKAPDGDWVRARPAEAFQYSLEADARGGVEPCGTGAPDEARKHQSALGGGQLYLPLDALDESGRFNLLLHLHGGEPVLREVVQSRERFVLYTHTFAPGRSYAPLFSGSALLPQLISQIEDAVRERSGRAATLNHLAVSAWSAGFEGIRALLHQPTRERVDALILIDGLHAPRDPQVLQLRMSPFVEFARRAERGERFMVVTHSSIPTEGYASTTETAHHLIHELGGKPIPVERTDGFGLSLVEFFTQGELHVRGYVGNDKADHCAQLFLLRGILPALGARWKSLPR